VSEETRQALELAANLLVKDMEEAQYSPESHKLMALWHDIRKIIGYPPNYGL
jgi:hypothetical protein